MVQSLEIDLVDEHSCLSGDRLGVFDRRDADLFSKWYFSIHNCAFLTSYYLLVAAVSRYSIFLSKPKNTPKQSRSGRSLGTWAMEFFLVWL